MNGPTEAQDALARLPVTNILVERRRAFGRLAVASSPGGEERFVARQESLLGGAGWSAALRIVAIDATTDSWEGMSIVHGPTNQLTGSPAHLIEFRLGALEAGLKNCHQHSHSAGTLEDAR